MISKITDYNNVSAQESEIKDYIMLMKPRVMALVVFSCFAGMVMAPSSIHPFLGFVLILSTALGHASAAALNMWYDSDIDSIMKRTQNRPLVRGVISREDCLIFAIILGLFSVMIMSLSINYLAGILLLITILFYIVIYTVWLKRTSIQNIVIGGAAGALPPVIGWAGVTGNITLEPIILFLLIFFWTPPHFWALALYQSDDYKKCNIPMMPIVKGDAYTKRQITYYTIFTVIVSTIPFCIRMNSVIYLMSALVLGSIFIYYAVSLKNDTKNLLAPRMFFFSITYLFLIFTFMMVDHYFMKSML